MKRYAYCLALLFWSVNLMAQQEYFIFIQADQNQPFYALIDTKTYSSSPRGNLIIPKLRDSTYKITIGFPGNKYPEQAFSVPMNKKDKGFQLKKISEGEWNLFNWQNQELIKPPQKVADQLAQGERKTDHFAVLMANVVNDSAVLYSSIASVEPGLPEKKEEIKTDLATTVNGTTTEIAKHTTSNEGEKIPDTKGLNKTDASKVESKDAVVLIAPNKKETPGTDSSKTKPLEVDSALVKVQDTSKLNSNAIGIKPLSEVDEQKNQAKDSSLAKTVDSIQTTELTASSIRKLSEYTSDQGKELVYVSSGTGSSADTVRIFIPFSFQVDSTAIAKQVDTPAHDEIEKLKPKVDSALVVNEKEVKKQDTISKQSVSNAAPVEEKKKNVQMVNSDCRSFAVDADVDKLRIKMLAENNVDDRIMAARKYLKTKCFYTKQIKSLSELFLSDEGRYRFFDASYPFVVDTENFRELVSLLHDEYFVNRFKAMVRL